MEQHGPCRMHGRGRAARQQGLQSRLRGAADETTAAGCSPRCKQGPEGSALLIVDPLHTDSSSEAPSAAHLSPGDAARFLPKKHGQKMFTDGSL